MRRRLLTFSVLFFALSCDDAPHPTGALDSPRGPSKIIQDGAHGGNPQFFFLPPMVPHPDEPDGFEFNNRLQPALSVDICELAATNLHPVTGRPTLATPCLNPQNPLKRFPTGSVQLVNSPRTVFGWWTFFNLPEDGFYYVLWNTKESRLDVSKYYRITVRLEGAPEALGIADVDPIRNLTQWQNSLTGEVIQLVDNMILPIPFRIGQAALCEETNTCTSATFSRDATETQVLQLEGEAGGGAIAAVSVPPGALPEDGPEFVTFNIERVNLGSTGILSNVSAQEGGATVCHPALPLQQFEGCFKITTTPELDRDPITGEMFTLDITVAACFELHDTEDPREEFVQLWSSDVDETPRPLVSTDASQLLGADADDCGENIVTVTSSNAFMRVAGAGLQKVQKGLGRFFGVKTAYAVDVGLGGLTKLLSNIGPALSADIRAHTDTEITPAPGETVISTARIVGTKTHDGRARTVGIPGVPVTYTLPNASHGSLNLLGTTGGSATAVTVITNDESIEENVFSGGGFAPVNWTLPSPTEAGTYTYTLTATGPALGGPVTFTATLTVDPPIVTAVSSALRLVANSTANGVLVQDVDATSQTTTLNQLSASVSALSVVGATSVQTQNSAVATWTDAASGRVAFTALGWTISAPAGSTDNHAVVANESDWTYKFTANSSGSFTIKYAVTLDAGTTNPFGLNWFSLSFLENGVLVNKEFFSAPSALGTVNQGVVTKAVVAGRAYTLVLGNNANVHFGPYTETAHMSGTFEWSVSPPSIP